VNYEYPPLGGGGGIVNAWLAEELSKRHEVTVLTSGAFDLRGQEVVRNVEVIRSRTFFRRQMAVANMPSMATFIIGGVQTARKLARKRAFDVVNTHFALPTGPVGSSVSGLQKVPNVLSVHGGDLYDPTKRMSPHRHLVLRIVVRHIVRCADAVVGQSKDTNDNLRRYYDPPTEPRLIPLAIPRPPAATADREELGLAADEFVMITIGRLVCRKATDQLVALLSRLENSKARLIVVGEGPDLGMLQQKARELGVSGRVTFTGFISEKRKFALLAVADLYVSTSQHEGFGLVFLEAMAHGLPIVCYDHGGQTDFLQSGINGAVLPLNDLDGFAGAVSEMMKDSVKRETIAARNRRDVEQYFIETCANRYEALFREVTGKNG
jgi:glycosyltransferase involved in cell wall biosynthesis